MGYRRTYLRRLRAAQRREKRLAVVALVGMVACAAAAVLLREPVSESAVGYAQAGAVPQPQALRLVAATAPAAHAGARRVYPFSVVPGGVAGREELVHVLSADKVVAVHYAGFQVARASAVTVSKPRAVYVSYRKGDQVFWTSKKVMLAQGETLLSDGSHEIRTRCGNRISDVPQMPVADGEPSAQLLDTAMSMDADVDGTDDDQRQAGTASDAASDAAGAAPAVGQTWRLAAFGASPVLAPRSATALALLGMSGMAGSAVPSLRAERLAPLSTTVIGAQTGVAGDTGTSTGTPGSSSDGSSGTGSTTDSTTGLTSTSGTSTSGTSTSGTSDSGTSTSGTSGSGTSGTSTTIMPDLGTGGDPAIVDTKAEVPPAPDPLSPSGAPPVVVAKAASTTNDVPEPGSLWLSGAALAAMRLLRRTPRRGQRSR